MAHHTTRSPMIDHYELTYVVDGRLTTVTARERVDIVRMARDCLLVNDLGTAVMVLACYMPKTVTADIFADAMSGGTTPLLTARIDKHRNHKPSSFNSY